MFEPGNLVRTITEDGIDHIFTVINMADSNLSVFVEDAEGFRSWKDTDSLELITDSVTEQVADPLPVPVNPSLDPAEIHAEINKMMVSIVRHVRELGIDETIYLKINCTNYCTDDSEVEYKAGISHHTEVVSDNLLTSANIAASRHLENKSMETKAIPHYK